MVLFRRVDRALCDFYPTWRARGLSKSFISRVIIGVTPFRVLITLLKIRHDRKPSMMVPYMGSCQNYGRFWGTLKNRCRIIIGTQTGTIILTTTHM